MPLKKSQLNELEKLLREERERALRPGQYSLDRHRPNAWESVTVAKPSG